MADVAVSLTDMNTGIAEFKARYSANNCPDFASPITICWSDLQTAVEVNGGISPINEIALKFIHRYDSGVWFLTMEVCHMNKNGVLDSFGSRFDLINGTITASSFKGDYDPNYFANVLFAGNALDAATFVHNMVFPWFQQISEIHCQNNLPDDNSNNMVFTSCSFYYDDTTKCLVNWPHCIVIYSSSTCHGDYVDDCSYTQMFTNKAGDYSTMCPPHCNCYNWPTALPVTAVCRK